LHAVDGSYTWSEAADLEDQDLKGVEQLGQSLIRELTASPNQAVIARRHAEHKESRDFYLQGRFNWKLATPDSIRNSVACFTRAVDCDGNYAAAWAALSQALLVSSMFGLLAPQETGQRMKEAALKATSLNPLLPEAHVALGAILSILDWNWEAGEQELEKSIQLDRHDPTGHITYGIQLACRGRFDAAVEEVERALELDPASLFPNFVLGWLYGVCHRFDEAISQHMLVSQLAPDYGLPYFGMGLAYEGKGMFEDAIAHFTNANQLKCRSLLHGHLGYCYAMAGRREEAQHEIRSLNERSASKYVSPMSFAAVYAGLGDKDQALQHMERALDVRDTSLPVNLLNPEFDSLRNESRFQALRERMGLLAG
jgi:serine/threonine-protein kinase